MLRQLLLAMILVGLVPWVSASAAATPPEVVADRTEIAVEVGSIFVVNYSIVSGRDASGFPYCPLDAARPVTLTIHTTFTLGAFPQSFQVTACDKPYPVSITASGIGVATIVVSASGGYADFYSTVRAGGIAYVHSRDDADPPRIFVPQVPLEAEAMSPLGAQVYADVSTSDNQTTPPQASCSPNGPWYPLGWTQVNCTAVDSNGNLGRANYSVHVYDRTPPAIGSPGDMTLFPSAEPIVHYAPSTWDLVWERTPLVCDPPSGSRFPAGTTLVRCTSTDGSGNTGYTNFSVTIIDIVRPRVIASDVVVEATGPGGAFVTLNAIPFDFIDPFPKMVCTPPSGGLFPLGTTSVTCTATDSSGNTASRTFTVTVVDTTPPAITLPALVGSEAVGSYGATVAWMSSAVDIVAGNRVVTCTPSSGSIFPIGTTRVNCTSVDTYGNRAWRDLDVVVKDTRAPIMLLPTDIGFEATSPAGASYAYTVPASDATGAVTPACTPPPGTFPLGVTTVKCTATDAWGNTATGSFTVTVVDTTPPTLVVPADIRVSTTGGPAAVPYTVSTSDIVDTDPDVVCTPPPGDFPVGETTVTCTSTDFSGNAETASFVVRVDAALPPTIAVPSDVVREATGPSGASYAFTATAWDPSSGTSLPVTCTPASGSVFPLGTTTVTCSATNAWGMTVSGTFTVKVVDTTPPVLALPAALSATAPASGGAPVSWSASAFDLVSLATAVTCTPASGSTFPVGTTTVTCSSTDAAGNRATASFPVTVSPAPTTQPCTVDGWKAPENTPGHTKTGINQFKLGSTVPLKIQTSCGQECEDDDDDDDGRSSHSLGTRSSRDDDDDDCDDDDDDRSAGHATPKLYYALVLPNGQLGPESPGKSKSSAYTANQFKTNGNHWQFDWDTRGLSAGVYRLRVDLGDGGINTLDMRLR